MHMEGIMLSNRQESGFDTHNTIIERDNSVERLHAWEKGPEEGQSGVLVTTTMEVCP